MSVIVDPGSGVADERRRAAPSRSARAVTRRPGRPTSTSTGARRSRSSCCTSCRCSRSSPASPGRRSGSRSCLYFVRMLAITGGYHRYFSHRSYRLGRVPQFVLAFVGTTAAQKGPLWWAAHHRAHHKYSDTERDIHSPIRGLLVEPRRLDPLRQVQQDRQRRDQGLHEVPGARVARQARLGRAVERSASCAISDRRVERSAHRVLRCRRSCCGTRRSA